ncbi:MAG TPA: CPBP family intramembrane metalloprotease [Cyanobacteria bacterium UBA8803]|nr:CPBP family intramembrane metalloprotease [Cyanobacteria bacterium UBA9273]HBL57303.1 CPBP family intramembrane metalloprotease [Cyanobacteria bacterium UBA8803]
MVALYLLINPTLTAGLQRIAHRLSAAVLSIPDAEAWLYTAILLLIFTILALPVGFQWRFIELDILRVSRRTIISIVATAFWLPAVTEELFFRVLLLPHTSELLSRFELWLWGCISVLLFIFYHPLNALTFFPRGRQVFFHPVFLVLAAWLGIICSIAYLQSGSLWTPVVLHWLVVIVWLLLLGGYKKLYG